MQALVVDDSRAMRIIIGRVLKELGYEVLEAGHGGEALTRLESAPEVSLAMVDWNMPVMNGYELVTAVRADARWSNVKMIMVTTESESAQVLKALDAGADEYVMKPFTTDILREKLAMLGLMPQGGVS
jgi:two-component system chemotaxis response regulator CheY